jgi:hypothetical protein
LEFETTPEPWTLDFGLGILVFGHLTLDF